MFDSIVQIQASFTRVFEELVKTQRALNDMPMPAEVAQHSGPTASVTADFSRALSSALAAARLATESLREDLVKLDSAVKLVAQELEDHDAKASLEAKMLMNAIDGIQEETVPLATVAKAPASAPADGATADKAMRR